MLDRLKTADLLAALYRIDRISLAAAAMFVCAIAIALIDNQNSNSAVALTTPRKTSSLLPSKPEISKPVVVAVIASVDPFPQRWSDLLLPPLPADAFVGVPYPVAAVKTVDEKIIPDQPHGVTPRPKSRRDGICDNGKRWYTRNGHRYWRCIR